MNQKMKILIAYDGSSCADAALDDLRRAGLPREAEAVVITVADVWLPPAPLSDYEPVTSAIDERIRARAQELGERAAHAVEQAHALALTASQRVREHFPTWEVRAEADAGSPASLVIEKAEQWQPDLIVVGSHGHSALERFMLGSVSLRIVTDACCSVRVARERVPESDRPVRLVIGVDGSPGADATVQAVAARAWPQQTEVRLVTSIGPFYQMTEAEIEEEQKRARNLQQQAESVLIAAGLEVSATVSGDDPKRTIIQEAENCEADCIFVGTSGSNRLGRLLLGSVSTAVVTRAHCSVEVVRSEERRLR